MAEKTLKVKILKPWICGLRKTEVGSWVDLPESVAKDGIARGLCVDAKGNLKIVMETARQAREKANKELAEAQKAMKAAEDAEAEAAAIEDDLAVQLGEKPKEKPLSKMNTAELEARAEDLGVDISGAKNNTERAALIQARLDGKDKKPEPEPQDDDGQTETGDESGEE